MAVRAIPEGHGTVTANLIVRDAKKAIKFYKKALGAEEIATMVGPNGKVVHAEIRIGNSVIMLADEMPEMDCISPETLGGSPVMFYVYVENVDALWKRATDAGMTPIMPLSDMFWGDRCGPVRDPFGYKWSLAQHVKDPSPAEMKKAEKEFFAQFSKK